MRPSRQIKLESIKLCFCLICLCGNERANRVCLLSVRATALLHGFSSRKESFILSKRSSCRLEDNIKINRKYGKRL